MTVRDLDGIILVGGPTRLPIIRKAVSNYFQQEPKADIDPDEVVAMGAAIHAASLVADSQDAVLLDVTPLDLCIGVAGGLAEPVIERNTPVPIEQSRSFSPFHDNQDSVQLKIYQGGSRQASENELLGQFEFSGFTPGLRSNTSIEVSFEINADGIVNVTARDPESGQQTSTEITLSSGLSKSEISDIMERNRTSDVKRTCKESEITSDDLGETSVIATDSTDDELELVSGDDLYEVSQYELDESSNEVTDDSNAISISDVAAFAEGDSLFDENADGDDAGPAIGKVSLKTVSVPNAPLTAPGATVDPDATLDQSLDKNELFDHDTDANLSGDIESEEE